MNDKPITHPLENLFPNTLTPFSLAHDDHGISEEQMIFIHTECMLENPNGFFIKEVQIPEVFGAVELGLYGPCEGDEAISEDEVIYQHRGDRPWKDRMISRPKRTTNRVQAIGSMQYDEEIGAYCLYYTVFGGALAPKHPEDPSNDDVEGSQKFWSEHALAL